MRQLLCAWVSVYLWVVSTKFVRTTVPTNFPQLANGSYKVQFWGQNGCKGKFLSYSKIKGQLTLVSSEEAASEWTLQRKEDGYTIQANAKDRWPNKLSYSPDCSSRSISFKRSMLLWKIFPRRAGANMYAVMAHWRARCPAKHAEMALWAKKAAKKTCVLHSVFVAPGDDWSQFWRFYPMERLEPANLATPGDPPAPAPEPLREPTNPAPTIQRPPPPPPPTISIGISTQGPYKPSPNEIPSAATWPATAVGAYAGADTVGLTFTPPSSLGDDETNMRYEIRCNVKDSGCRPASASDVKSSVTLTCSTLATCGGAGATAITATLSSALSSLPITATPTDGYDCYVISMNRFMPTVSQGTCSAPLRFVPKAPTAATGVAVSNGPDDLSVSFTASSTDDGVSSGLYAVRCVAYGDASGCNGVVAVGASPASPSQVADPTTPISYTFPSSSGSNTYYDCYYAAENQYGAGASRVCSSKASIVCTSGNVCKEVIVPGPATSLTYNGRISTYSFRVGFTISNPPGYLEESYTVFCHVSTFTPVGDKCVDAGSNSFASSTISRPSSGTTTSGVVTVSQPNYNQIGYNCYVKAANGPDNSVCSGKKYILFT